MAKNQLTERQAVALFTQHMIDCAIYYWPVIYKNLQNITEGKFVVKDREQAVFDLEIAATALDLQAVANLFPEDQAHRIENLVYQSGHSKKYGDYVREELARYSREFQKEIELVDSGQDGNPMEIVPALLLHRWLGDDLRNFDMEINGRKTGTISPLLVLAVVGVLVAPPFVGTWKAITDKFELVQD